MRKFKISLTLLVGEISPLLIALLALSLMGARLNAGPITWYIENANLGNGGVLTGAFDYDATTGAITNIALISTQDGTVLPPETWTSATLYPGTGYALPTAIQLVNDDLYGLQLDFSPALTNSDGTSDFPLGGSLITGPLGPTGQTDLFQSGEVTTQVETLINFQGGSSSTPVLLPSGEPVAELSGTIGGVGSEDYYLFSWAGGAFSATASITDAPNVGASYLFSGGNAGSCSSGGTATLNSDDSFTNTITIGDLAAGQYCIGIDANNANDPAFALTFNTPVTGTSTPEPSGFVLLSIGLGMISFLRLTKRGADKSAAA